MKTLHLIPLACLLLLVCACGSKRLETLPFDVEYTVVKMNGKSLEGGNRPTLLFTKEGAIYGTTGCNRYFGNYTYEDKVLKVEDNMGVTRMACPDAEDIETPFLKLITQVSSVRQTPTGGLSLQSPDGAEMIAEKLPVE